VLKIYNLLTIMIIKMHVISKKPFNDAKKKFPNDASAIDDLYKVLKGGTFYSPEELKS
jgi:mRNA interferase HigB